MDWLLILTEKKLALSFQQFLEKNIFLEKVVVSPFKKKINLFFYPPENKNQTSFNFLKKIKKEHLFEWEKMLLINSNFTFYHDYFSISTQRENNLIKNKKKEKVDYFDILVFEKSKWLKREILGDNLSFLETHFYENVRNFNKSCYPGQEIIARFKSRDRESVKKLVLLKLVNSDPSLLEIDLKQIQFNPKVIFSLLEINYCPSFKEIMILAIINNKKMKEASEMNYLEFREEKFFFEVMFLPHTKLATTNLFSRENQIAKDLTYIEYYNLGFDYFHQKKLELAKANFLKAIKENQSYEPAWEALAICEERVGNYSQAVKVNQQLIKLNPKLVLPHTNLSRIYMLQGAIKEAENENKKATVLMFKVAANKKKAITKQAEELKWKKQIDFYSSIIQEMPQDDISYFQLGKIYYEKKDFNLAKKCFKQVIAINKSYSLAYYHLTETLLALGEKKLAQTILGKGIKVARNIGEFIPLKKMENLLSRI